MFSFFKRPKRPVPAAPIPVTTLHFEIMSDGSVFIESQWPYPTTDKDAQELVLNYSRMVFLLNTGTFISHIQKAIVEHGMASGQLGIAKAIAANINTLIEETADMEAHDTNSAVVPPTAVFSLEKT